MEIKYLSMDEIKSVELEILKYIHNFCIENDIKYFLNYGTLIGALRHKGFIPWDDDIDICMFRKDYEKFIDLFSKDDGIYKILSLETDDKYYNNFMKVINSKTKIEDERNYKTYDLGIFVDIFPIDSFDDLKLVEKTYKLESFKLLSFSKKENIQYGDSKLKDFVRLFFWTMLKPVSPRIFAKKIKEAVEKYSKENGKYFGVVGCSKLKYDDVFDYNPFDELAEFEFEGCNFFAPKKYDEILKKYYGDYMKFPPVDKQKYPHEIKAYFVD